MKTGGIKRRRNSTSTKPSNKPYKRRKVSKNVKRQRSKAFTSNQYLTDQFDKRVDYVAVKARKDSRKVKKDIKFKNAVMKALTPQVPTINKLYVTTAVSVTNTGATDQCYVIFHMRPWEGQAATPGTGTLYNEPAQVDLKDMYDELAAGMDSVSYSTDFVVKSSMMDIYVEPTGTTDCIFDVYEIVYQKKKGNPVDQFGSLYTIYNSAIGNGTSGANQISLGTRGGSPFDLTQALRDVGVKVVKKTSNFVQTGSGGFQYTVKDYRRQNIQGTVANSDLNDKFCMQGFTKSVLIICKTLVSDSSSVTGFRASREVHYRIEPKINSQSYKEFTGLN